MSFLRNATHILSPVSTPSFQALSHEPRGAPASPVVYAYITCPHHQWTSASASASHLPSPYLHLPHHPFPLPPH